MSLSLNRVRCPSTIRRLPRLLRTYATAPPPPPRQYKPAPPRAEAEPSPTLDSPKPKHEPPDPARGQAAMIRYVTEGKLDPRYKPAARRVTAIICAVPILIYTSWLLHKRLVLGEEQKRIVHKDGKVLPGEEDGNDVEVVVDG